MSDIFGPASLSFIVRRQSKLATLIVDMIQALLRGIIGVLLGLGITYLITLSKPAPWGLSEVLTAVGLASFCAAFFTGLAARRPSIPNKSEGKTTKDA